ncbi:hypothetical protein PoB_005777700 [Plakobranchus ocellatus]|uniref:Uncharacterized protein n=1 Tax=Plakobranchus ocellatus TaxID=259542 RepID=A0AAV4CI16_9GAST|nr:hypothetical protein PoB_005777700 [Plakobranchus ocellatus]
MHQPQTPCWTGWLDKGTNFITICHPNCSGFTRFESNQPPDRSRGLFIFVAQVCPPRDDLRLLGPHLARTCSNQQKSGWVHKHLCHQTLKRAEDLI